MRADSEKPKVPMGAVSPFNMGDGGSSDGTGHYEQGRVPRVLEPSVWPARGSLGARRKTTRNKVKMGVRSRSFQPRSSSDDEASMTAFQLRGKRMMPFGDSPEMKPPVYSVDSSDGDNDSTRGVKGSD